MGRGLVYVVHNDWIQNPDIKKGYRTYKIGITTVSVSNRYYGLGLKMPSEFVCDFSYKFDSEQYKEVEKRLKKILNQSNVGGEWYDLNNDTLNVVHSICKDNGGKLITNAVDGEIVVDGKQLITKERNRLHLEHWDYLTNYLYQQGYSLEIYIDCGTPDSLPLCFVPIKNTNIEIVMSNLNQQDVYYSLIYIGESTNAKKIYFKLSEERQIIEKEMELELGWKWDEEYNIPLIYVSRDGNIEDREQWEEITEWFKKIFELFCKFFLNRVKNLRL
jgi:hypothetical protein